MYSGRSVVYWWGALHGTASPETEVNAGVRRELDYCMFEDMVVPVEVIKPTTALRASSNFHKRYTFVGGDIVLIGSIVVIR